MERSQRENFIETKYIGKDETLRGKLGEAFLDLTSNQWKFRPYKDKPTFINVDAKDLDCANDSGWVRGIYLGLKAVPKIGKAYWSESEDAWVYKPKGLQRTIVVQEADFQMERDEDY